MRSFLLLGLCSAVLCSQRAAARKHSATADSPRFPFSKLTPGFRPPSVRGASHARVPPLPAHAYTARHDATTQHAPAHLHAR